ncbi:hypothetical protein EDB81DRAFT_395856 [Dactylonectria macrodidyma]|uniref:C2H2-type domain-containing protein n=1 Tax=Dactylonectria macrodidyma TaxID=307937 RepID=A0A9P9FA55_9HYPO|nr:hypothetical protein EDB81DRAFT_395856 [Dactylonectria macrodidyma]
MAMLINISSILIASLFTVLSCMSILPCLHSRLLKAAVLFPNKWPILAAVVAPLLKHLGGGAHASAFLPLDVLYSQPNIRLRFVHASSSCPRCWILMVLQSHAFLHHRKRHRLHSGLQPSLCFLPNPFTAKVDDGAKRASRG